MKLLNNTFLVKNMTGQDIWGRVSFRATHSSVLALRIPGTEEPGGLPSMGSHRVRHN